MDQLNHDALEQIPIPEGLTERLSAKIDQWEQEEQLQLQQQHAQRRKLYVRMLRPAAIAACMALVFGVGYLQLSQEGYQNLAEQDTYQDPVKAQQEVQRALTLLAVNLNRGMTQMEKARSLSDKTERTLNEQLNNLK